MKKLIIVLFIIAYTIYSYAQSDRIFIGDTALNVIISFEREFFRIGDDIYLFIEISNGSDKPVSFYASPYKLNNVKLLIKDLQTGELLDEKYLKYIKDKNLKTKRPELFEFQKKELYPDEIYKFKLNLPEYFKFVHEGRYKIIIEFDPFPNSADDHRRLSSNPVYLLLKDSQQEEEIKDLILSLKKFEESKRYTPEGTIKFMLDSYMEGNWENYFLYQNLDTIIHEYNQYKDKYKKASDVMKKEIIGEFKTWMINRENRVIESYEILNVNRSYKTKKSTSTVTCRVKYKNPAMYKNFTYIYRLHQEGVKWIVDSLDAISYSKKR